MEPTSSREASIALAAHGGDLWNRLERPEPAAGALYWLESTPPDGRTQLLRRTAEGRVEVVSPPGADVRNGVHEYGGGSYAVDGETVVFSSLREGRLVRVTAEGCEPLTEAPPVPDAVRYGDLAFARGDIVCVRETHGDGGVVNELIRVSIDDGTITVISAGHDFYSFPCANADGSMLAWTTWDHPGVPFLGSDLWCAAVGPDGQLLDVRHVAGGSAESIFQPQWSPDGRLFYVSDRSGWWNLYAADESVGSVAAELGWPQWLLGLSSYAFLDDGRIAALLNRRGRQRLAFLTDGKWEDAGLPYDHVAWPYLRGDGRQVAFVAAGPDRPPELVVVDTDSGAFEVVRRSLELPPGDVARASQIVVERPDGDSVYAYLYARDTSAPPPLVVLAHGGPTDQTAAGLRLDVQLLTSRGYAVVDVDYGGSTGYGRPQRERLAGAWGWRDVEDCVLVAQRLAADGAADPARIAIMGGSAGGYIALCGLAFHDTFCAGVSLYGIADPQLFDAQTHKFEASYTSWLTGNGTHLRAPARARSFSGPLLLLQGTDDRIVTPAHFERMVAAYGAAGMPVEAVLIEGEGHGFRREDSLLRVYSAILDFLERSFADARQGK